MKRLVITMLLIAAPMSATPASAQTRVFGTVTLALDQHPVSDVTVEFERNGYVYATTTGTDGSYAVELQFPTVVDEIVQVQSAGTILGAAYPNPFNPTTQIPFTTGAPGPVKLAIYSGGGQLVRLLIDGELGAGTWEFTWDGYADDGRSVASGTYLYQLWTPDAAASGKVTLLNGARGPRSLPVSAGKPEVDGVADSPVNVVLSGEAIATLVIEELVLPVAEGQIDFQVEPASFKLTRPRGRAVSLVGVPGGPFVMGSNRYQDEQPVHQVFVSSYLLQAHEVTVEEYSDCVAHDGCREAATGEGCNWLALGGDRNRHPINCINWFDAVAYCSWAGMRLPTEAEWEKAARGTAGHSYPWGNEPPGGAGNCDRATMMKAGLGLGCGHEGTAPVGSASEGTSPYGVEDMAGNVWEWVADWYDADYYSSSPQRDPLNKAPTGYRALRGNSWFYVDPDPDMRAANRYRFRPLRWYPYIGVRCATSQASNLGALPMDEVSGRALEQTDRHSTWTKKNDLARRAEGDTLGARPAILPTAMITIPAGKFTMGSNRFSGDERPMRVVWLDEFEIDEYEVAVGQYRTCVEVDLCDEPYSGNDAYKLSFEGNFTNWQKADREHHPVNAVSWEQARQYCDWAGKRLPTEAEWEKAARGTDGRVYPWGDTEGSCELIVMDDGGDGCGWESTWPVGAKSQGRSPYGVADMSGNVWEWTDDWYDRTYYAEGPARNPHNTDPGIGKKVLRGGSLADQNPHIHRAANRLAYDPLQRFDYTIGFRCARSPAP